MSATERRRFPTDTKEAQPRITQKGRRTCGRKMKRTLFCFARPCILFEQCFHIEGKRKWHVSSWKTPILSPHCIWRKFTRTAISPMWLLDQISGNNVANAPCTCKIKRAGPTFEMGAACGGRFENGLFKHCSCLLNREHSWN